MPISNRFAAAAVIGSSGSLVMLAMLFPQPWANWPLIVAAAIGASGAGYLFAGCFGRPGRRGLGFCVLGALLTTLTGAAFAGLGLGLVTAMTPLGLFFGPMAVGQALLTSPLVLLTWVSTMALAHLVMGQVRARHFMPS